MKIVYIFLHKKHEIIEILKSLLLLLLLNVVVVIIAAAAVHYNAIMRIRGFFFYLNKSISLITTQLIYIIV